MIYYLNGFVALNNAMKEKMSTRLSDHSGSVPSGEAHSLEVEQTIEKLLANASLKELTQWCLKAGQNPQMIPPLFRHRLRNYRLQGSLRRNVERYYYNLRRGDSKNFPAQDGGKSLIQTILEQDATSSKNKGSEGRWRPGCLIGSGGYGSVALWKKLRRHGPVHPPSTGIQMDTVLI